MNKVLIFTPGFYPAKTYGGPVASISNLIEAFAKEIEFFLITSDHELNDKKCLSGVKRGWNQVGFAKVLYLSDKEMTRKKFEKIIDQISPDCIYLNAIFHKLSTPQFLILARRKKVKCVLAIRGGLCENALQFGRIKKLIYIQFLKIIKGKDVTYHSTSPEETATIRKYMGKKAHIIEVSNIPLLRNPLDLPNKSWKEKGTVRMIFVSRIHPIKNLDYIIDILNNVSSKVQFDIYGPKEKRDYWEKCEAKIQRLPPNIQVHYCGFLDKSVRDEIFKNYDLFVLPTLSENFGHAISEALSEHCNVLISNNTPWNDINNFKAGRAFDLNEKERFSDYIEHIAQMTNEEIVDNRSDIDDYLRSHFNYDCMKNKYFEMLCH
ncbi:MAG TPA: glycosyltransferase [[Clostridium] spiroforme]|uniref:Glycosyltransferase n=1 Tax=Thomasclavelia spiroformis TaxID=29348 RepID=A0A921G9U6_9FIRM|nr:glycosyltransferase [Thomasclavelia spiroformis]